MQVVPYFALYEMLKLKRNGTSFLSLIRHRMTSISGKAGCNSLAARQLRLMLMGFPGMCFTHAMIKFRQWNHQSNSVGMPNSCRKHCQQKKKFPVFASFPNLYLRCFAQWHLLSGFCPQDKWISVSLSSRSSFFGHIRLEPYYFMSLRKNQNAHCSHHSNGSTRLWTDGLNSNFNWSTVLNHGSASEWISILGFP